MFLLCSLQDFALDPAGAAQTPRVCRESATASLAPACAAELSPAGAGSSRGAAGKGTPRFLAGRAADPAGYAQAYRAARRVLSGAAPRWDLARREHGGARGVRQDGSRAKPGRRCSRRAHPGARPKPIVAGLRLGSGTGARPRRQHRPFPKRVVLAPGSDPCPGRSDPRTSAIVAPEPFAWSAPPRDPSRINLNNIL